MLAEYALIPDVFDEDCYSSSDLCNSRLQLLKEPLLEEALIRDLSDGQLHRYLKSESFKKHLRAKELIRKLISQKRFCLFPTVKHNVPANYVEWCDEAIASNTKEPLNGVISNKSTAEHFKKEKIVSSIEKLPNTSWWQDRGPSIRIRRQTIDYLDRLKKVLGNANSIMFIDPYLDPTQKNYNEFINLLKATKRSELQPLIEIHRVCYVGSGKNKEYLTMDDWKNRFKQSIHEELNKCGLTVTIFFWDNFHDRYLITNLIGISLPHGFDVSRHSDEMTTWARLSRKNRDDIQREFDPGAKRRTLKYTFKAGFDSNDLDIVVDVK
ncbi:MAG TPA: hypothetical protein PKW97_13315 [Syntrophorhabdus sp.]|nr:hypothetical protein [Syntrophorhabdus sp.]